MSYLYLTILFPLIGFVLLAAGRNKLPENVAAIIGVGAVGLSALFALIAGLDFVNNGKELYVQHLWTWFNVGGFAPGISLQLDGLSLLMLGMVTGVGFLIHIFASWYMRGEEDFARFFSYFNLFVASMLLLVLGDNLALLFLGWEGVGLCSYLLIGYYYQNPANGLAAIKAFTVTRIGDVFLLIAMFLIFQQFGTLNIQYIVENAATVMTQSSSLTIWTALLLFLGAAGKSAQIPLQTWLADAMAGPTPVSALIHAATMVTAGVYLCCRLFAVFELAPEVMVFISITGAVTLLVAGFAALVQTDIKRILAYSTMSQLGYMFMAVGAEAYQAGLFHMLTHAFFKALLFLSSGAVILAYHHEQNIFKMAADERVVVAPNLIQVINGLGAGDSFGGSLCHGLHTGQSLEETLTRCNAAGAIVTSRLECSTAMPTTEEIDLLIAGGDPNKGQTVDEMLGALRNRGAVGAEQR